MRTTILGLGMIGGSIARALRAGPKAADGGWPVSAWSPRGTGSRRAAAEGVVDRAASSLAEAVREADLVIIAAPPLAAVALVGELGLLRGGVLPADATVTDVTSTKTAIVRAAEAAAVPFVGGHPMAGTELSGFEAADAGLFVGRPWVLSSCATTRIVDAERVGQLVEICGAVPVAMEAATHDRAVAAISHLPLLLSVALVESVVGVGDEADAAAFPAERALASSGWRDMTRLARGNVDMGAGIVATNGEALGERLRETRAILDDWLRILELDPDALAAAARERLAAARLRAGGGL